jgi:hypothetical protein
MVSLEQLWLPIVVAAVFVFVASSVIHMVIKWHAADYHALSNEEAVRAAVRAGNPVPGQYIIPYCADMKDMKSEAMQQKFREGPVGFLVLRPNGMGSMGKMLGQWFALAVFVAIVAAYVTAHAIVVPNPSAMSVARYAGTVTFMSYSVGTISHAIWWGKTWRTAAFEVLDAAIYACAAAAAFAWLWPR